ncbi:MAG: hypothetical protein ACLFU0_04705 [Alphaproteobacteria bacterium]
MKTSLRRSAEPILSSEVDLAREGPAISPFRFSLDAAGDLVPGRVHGCPSGGARAARRDPGAACRHGHGGARRRHRRARAELLERPEPVSREFAGTEAAAADIPDRRIVEGEAIDDPARLR